MLKSASISMALSEMLIGLFIGLVVAASVYLIMKLQLRHRISIVEKEFAKTWAEQESSVRKDAADRSRYVIKGKIAEHIVGQELLGQSRTFTNKVQFWVREKKQSSAQVDYVVPFDNYVMPIEVKAGKAGRLRSLHEFIDRTSHAYAVRVYSGRLKIDTINTIKGKKFFLEYCMKMFCEKK